MNPFAYGPILLLLCKVSGKFFLFTDIDCSTIREFSSKREVSEIID